MDVYSSDDYERRERYSAMGRVRCPYCVGGTCTHCGSTGYVRCEDCHGHGRSRIPVYRKRRRPDTDEADDTATMDADEGGAEPVTPERSLDELKVEGESDLEIARMDAEAERERLMTWVLDQDAFPLELRQNLYQWLSSLHLEHPEAPQRLEQTAEQYAIRELPAAYGTLRLKLRGLGGAFSKVMFYKSMLE